MIKKKNYKKKEPKKEYPLCKELYLYAMLKNFIVSDSLNMKIPHFKTGPN